MTQAQKAQRAAGKKNVPHAWDKKHVGVGAVMHNGKKTWGVWEFPARQRIVNQVPVMRNGAPVFKKAKGGRRGFNGRFAKKGSMVQLMCQRAQLVEVGEPKRIAEGRKVTRHPKLIDFDALTGVPPERRQKVRRLLREGAAQPGAGVT
ncbi:hypothetical protein [Bradyrhizobium diazoefficiens]|uniref:hypothetical protein n=1 Tax=Bradyrhizobium diazoefficiens TaxID=1355477 RepID=UPI0004BC6763|nr:hypothetical protein [Bradyrhizobium diazoefficiens]